jgi:hypothetical protein
LEIAGDGNCFFRALSMGLYGDQLSHQFLRLLTSLEMILHKDYYDASRDECQCLINDSRLFVPPYMEAVKAVCTLAAYVEMLHIFAASAAVNMPIQSYCPPSLRFRAA